MQLSPLDEGFVRTAVTINRMLRGEWQTTYEADYEAEVYRVQQELDHTRAFLTRGLGAVALREEDGSLKAVGYGYAYEGVDSLWIGGLGVVPQEVGNGIMPALAQVMLAVSNRKGNKQVIDPRNVLPPLLAGALDEQEIAEVPELPAKPRIADVQLALLAHPNLAEYDVKKS